MSKRQIKPDKAKEIREERSRLKRLGITPVDGKLGAPRQQLPLIHDEPRNHGGAGYLVPPGAWQRWADKYGVTVEELFALIQQRQTYEHT